MKINGDISGDSATGRKKVTTRQWAALIGFCSVENWKQVQKKLEVNRKGSWRNGGVHHCGYHNQGKKKLMLTDSPAGCGLATISRKTSGNTDSPMDQWKTWQKLSRHLDYGFHLLDCTRNFGDVVDWAVKRVHQSYHPRNSDCFSEETTPTSNVTRHSKPSDANLFLVPEDIVCNEGARKTGRVCGTSWVTKHEWAGGKYGGIFSGASVLGSTRQ